MATLAFHSDTFLGWQSDFLRENHMPFLYEDFSIKKRPQISFSVSFQSLPASEVPQCGDLLGKAQIIAHVFSESPSFHKASFRYGVDIIRDNLIPFFRGRYVILSSSLEISEALVGEEEAKQLTIIHTCQFTLKNLFTLGRV